MNPTGQVPQDEWQPVDLFPALVKLSSLELMHLSYIHVMDSYPFHFSSDSCLVKG